MSLDPRIRERPVPTYRRHKQSGQAVVTLTDGLGRRKDVLLGKWKSRESRMEYARVIAEWEANDRRLPQKPHAANDVTVNELAWAYWQHAEKHYRKPDGRPTSELNCLRAALRPLKELYALSAVKDFSPVQLKAIRERMAATIDPRTGRGWCRRTVNLHLSRVRAIFRWGTENGLVPPTIYHGLLAVRGVQRGRSAARETPPVKPVPEAVVEQTIPHMPSTVAAMVRLQLLTGMRPGEVCIVRGCDLTLDGETWTYKPGSDLEHGDHKTAWHGHTRTVVIGPRGQEVLKPFLKANLSAYLFSDDSGETPYTAAAYRRAITRACDRAFPPPADLRPRREPGRRPETWKAFRARLTPEQHAERKNWLESHRWHPHQLRHTAATALRREVGVDTVRALLGHHALGVTELYAEKDLQAAAAAMKKLG